MSIAIGDDNESINENVRFPDIFPESIDTDNAHEVREGQVGTIKGKFQSIVRYAGAQMAGALDEVIVIGFPDWTDLTILTRVPWPKASLKGDYFGVKVQKRGDYFWALAIWELGGGAVIPMDEPTTIPERGHA